MYIILQDTHTHTAIHWKQILLRHKYVKTFETSKPSLYVCPKIYIRRALSENVTVAPWSQTHRNVF